LDPNSDGFGCFRRLLSSRQHLRVHELHRPDDARRQRPPHRGLLPLRRRVQHQPGNVALTDLFAGELVAENVIQGHDLAQNAQKDIRQRDLWQGIKIALKMGGNVKNRNYEVRNSWRQSDKVRTYFLNLFYVKKFEAIIFEIL
jgi:hypothetical protein